MKNHSETFARAFAEQARLQRHFGFIMLAFVPGYVLFVYTVGWGGLVFHIGLLAVPFILFQVFSVRLNRFLQKHVLPDFAEQRGLKLTPNPDKPTHLFETGIFPPKTIRKCGPHVLGGVEGTPFEMHDIEIVHRTLGRSTGKVTFEGLVFEFEQYPGTNWAVFHDPDVRVFEDPTRTQFFDGPRRVVYDGLTEGQGRQIWSAFSEKFQDPYVSFAIGRRQDRLIVALKGAEFPFQVMGLFDDQDDVIENLNSVSNTMQMPQQILKWVQDEGLDQV